MIVVKDMDSPIELGEFYVCFKSDKDISLMTDDEMQKLNKLLVMFVFKLEKTSYDILVSEWRIKDIEQDIEDIHNYKFMDDVAGLQILANEAPSANAIKDLIGYSKGIFTSPFLMTNKTSENVYFMEVLTEHMKDKMPLRNINDDNSGRTANELELIAAAGLSQESLANIQTCRKGEIIDNSKTYIFYPLGSDGKSMTENIIVCRTGYERDNASNIKGLAYDGLFNASADLDQLSAYVITGMRFSYEAKNPILIRELAKHMDIKGDYGCCKITSCNKMTFHEAEGRIFAEIRC